MTTTGIYTEIQLTSDGCEREQILNLTVLASDVSETEVITVCQSEVPVVWNGEVYNESGTYMMEVANANGCITTQTLELIVLSLIHI